MNLRIERDAQHFFGYYVIAGNYCIAYTFTKWGANRVFNRHKNKIVKSVEL